MSNDDDIIWEENINYKSICCTNIPELFLDKLTAKKHFSKFGKINRFIFCPKRLSCTVEYEKEEDAKNAYENASNYNGHYFNIRYATNEIAHTQNTEEWVNPEVQAELDAMGNAILNSSRMQHQQQQQQQQQQRISARALKSILKSSPRFTNPSSINVNMSGAASTDMPKIDNAVKQELEMILRKQAFNAEDKYKILDARDKLIRLTTVRTTDIKKVVSTKGTCPDMCPEKERLLRESKRQVSSFEMYLDRDEINHKYAIKEYSRSSADQETPLPHELRPEIILKMTMTYLMHNIMNICDNLDTNLGDWYHFVWDRTRSIRKDITQQELCSLDTVKLVEQCARFHIHCAARLIAEDSSVFDQKINTENLTKCLQTLKYMYHDLRLKNIQCPNESEFRSYVILLNLNDGNFLWELKHLPDNIQNSNEIRDALSFYLAIDCNNYVKFFKLIKKTTYMNACILLRYFNQVRDIAIRIIMKAYIKSFSIPLDYLKNILLFESEKETISFFNHYGLKCDNGKVILDRYSFYEPDIPYTMDRSYIVESKRLTSVGEAICGQKLDSIDIFDNYIPHDSFDEYGYLKSDSWLAEDQFNKKQNNLDNNLFKIPRSSPPISPKQQQQQQHFKIPQFGMKFDQNLIKSSTFSVITTKPSTTTSNSTSITFGVKTPITQSKNDDTKSTAFVLPAFKDFTSPRSSLSEDNTNLQGIPETESSFKSDIFGRKLPSQNNIHQFNSVQKSNLNTFDNQKSSKLPSSQNSSKFSILTPKDSSAFKETDVKKVLKMNKSDDHKDIEIKTTEQDKLNKENELLKSKEKERIEKEEKEKHEKHLKQIEKNTENIYNEILEDIISNEIKIIISEEISYYEKLLSIIDNFHETIIKEQINDDIQEIAKNELIKFNKEQEIIIKYIKLWKDKTKKRLERRNLIESTPIWITDESLIEQASNLTHSKLNETLEMTKRYRLGEPFKFNINFNKKLTNIKINLYELFSNELLKNQINNENIYLKGFFKHKKYFKCIISLPEEPQNYQEHENSKGFYEYMNSCLKKHLLPSSSTLCDQKYGFICEDYDNISYCIRKIHGIYPKNENNEKIKNECDNSNGIIFIMTCSNLKNSKKRLDNLLNSSTIHLMKNIPLIIIIYNSTILKNDIEKELNLQKYIENDLIKNYKILELYEKDNKNNFKKILEESFKYLINLLPINNELEMQKLSSFLCITLGDEFWNRLYNSSIINPAFNKYCKKPDNLINLYNYAINKLINIINENYDNYTDFPIELKQFIKESYSNNDDDIPLDIEYFPNDWKIYQTEKQYRIKEFLLKNQLPNFLNDNHNNIIISNDLYQLENLILQYTDKCFPFNKEQSKKTGYNAIKILLNKLNNPNLKHLNISSRFYNITWLEIIKIITLEFMLYNWNNNYKYLPKDIIYNKNLLNDYIHKPWWLKLDSLKTIKMIPTTKSSSLHHPSSSALALASSSKYNKTCENVPENLEDFHSNNDDDDVDVDGDDDVDDDAPKSKKLKYENNSLNVVNKNELDDLLQKGYSMIQKAERNIEKFNKYSTLNRNICKNLDIEFYQQEKINQNLRKFLNENRYN